MARAQRWMARHLRRSFQLAELADHPAVSARTISRRFKAATGEPPLRYVQLLRIETAKRLLEGSGLGVDAVCERVGYGDLSTFRRLFKRETGVSPSEYQRRFVRRHRPSPRLRSGRPAVRPGDERQQEMH